MVEPDQQRRVNKEAGNEADENYLARGECRPLQYFSSDQRKRQTWVSPILPLHSPLHLMLVQLLPIMDSATETFLCSLFWAI